MFNYAMTCVHTVAQFTLIKMCLVTYLATVGTLKKKRGIDSLLGHIRPQNHKLFKTIRLRLEQEIQVCRYSN